jgi:protein O-mannosyl-transferase
MYRKILHLVALCFLTFGLLAQQKGVTPVDDGKNTVTMGRTFALIVGVSEYRDSLIPDLKYADKDASAFATWLMTQKGADSPSSNIKVLLNEKATGAAVKIALSDLPRVCEKGDRVYLFFSGHSDVERDVDNEPGYFLCYDSPSRVYMNGALNLANVQEITNTLRFRKQ